ncbi:MAG: IscS subfamily cysteine desulfurase [Kangiellaceae bacterium]|nr:IscS subfamily cysteine desulfurase [Kangiellaceae bacterium]
MNNLIYLDYAATTPVDPRVAEAMADCLTIDGTFGNAASRSHRFGWQAEEKVDIARNQVADLIGADVREVIWTSGATESDNLVLKSIAACHKTGHIITSAIEHKAILDCCQYLEKQGFSVTYLQPSTGGIISAEQVSNAIQKDTILISIMHVNNELGVVSDIKGIGIIAHEHHIPFHVDAAQSVGKIAIDLTELPVDFMSFSAHKIYGPKGMGALFARNNQQPNIESQIHGGGHERGLRSGTLATHQIVGMGLAFELAREELAQNKRHSLLLKKQFVDAVTQEEAVFINGNLESSVDGIVNLRFGYVDSESLLMAFKSLAVSSGSACTSASVEPSYVLRAIGLTDQQAHSSLRFSFGRFTTEQDVKVAIEIVKTGLTKLRAMSLEWLARNN